MGTAITDSEAAENAPTVTRVLQIAARDDVSASDIHIHVGSPPWMKVGGLLSAVENASPVSKEEADFVVEWFGGMEVSKTVTYPESTGQRWRGQTYLTATGPAVSIRRLATSAPSISDLGHGLSEVRDALKLSEGLVVVAGGTGSGKSTTLAAIISLIAEHRSCHVITIENPIEIIFENGLCMFSQRETGMHVDTAETAFISAMRSAPDVILLGEIRTEAEAELCLDAAISGHLVLTSMHARDAGTVIERLCGTSGTIGQSKMAQACRMVISQRLIPDARDRRRLHAYAEIVHRAEWLVNEIRQGKMATLNSLISEHYSGGLDGQLAAAVVNGEITVNDAEAQAIKLSDFRKRYDSLAGAARRPQ